VRRLGSCYLRIIGIRINKRKYLLSIAFLIYLGKFSATLANEGNPEWGPWSVSPSSPVVEKNIQNIRGDGADTRISSTKFPFVWALKLYRKFISPVSGNRCQMYPTCSHYSLLAFEKHGPLLGTIMTADRLMRCNPSCAESHPLIYRGERYRCYDPVENNDFWFTSSSNHKFQKGNSFRAIREIRGSNPNDQIPNHELHELHKLSDS